MGHETCDSFTGITSFLAASTPCSIRILSEVLFEMGFVAIKVIKMLSAQQTISGFLFLVKLIHHREHCVAYMIRPRQCLLDPLIRNLSPRSGHAVDIMLIFLIDFHKLLLHDINILITYRLKVFESREMIGIEWQNCSHFDGNVWIPSCLMNLLLRI